MNINKDNIEVILYDYAEGNYSDKERKEVEAYLDSHPQYKEMLAEYDPLLTVPMEKEGVFGQKEKILSQTVGMKSPKTVLITRYIKRIGSVAAVILLLIAINSLYNLSSPDSEEPKLQVNNTKTQNNSFPKPSGGVPEVVGQYSRSRRAVFPKPSGENKVRVYNNKTTEKDLETQESTSDNESLIQQNEEFFPLNAEYAMSDATNTPYNADLQQDNIGIMTSSEDWILADSGNPEAISDDDQTEYRIIFFNNKPTVWKRIKRWFNRSKEELFAEK